MKFSYEWLQSFFVNPPPKAERVAYLLNETSFEVDSVEDIGGDKVLDIKVLANRAHDCFSHEGIAREIHAILRLPLKKSKALSLSDISSSRSPQVRGVDGYECRRYAAVLLRGVRVKESPEWLTRRLKAIGVRSINNLVDVVNYVMFDVGQPLHAFDLGKLKSRGGISSITVRRGEKGERLRVLAGGEYDVDNALLITDGISNAPLAIAGIKGAEAAEIDEKTESVLIESANFDPVDIRLTSQRLNLRTDAALRFEHDLSPEFVAIGLGRAITLLQEIVGGTLEGVVDLYPRQPAPFHLGVSVKEAQRLLDIDLKEEDIEEIFRERLGFEIAAVEPQSKVVAEARRYLGAPYRFGASITYDAPHAFDCSSFTSFVFSRAGIQIPRISVDQFLFSIPLSEEERLPGDLIFARGEKPLLRTAAPEGGVGHVGIYIGNGEVIHASGAAGQRKVVIEHYQSSAVFRSHLGFRRAITEDGRRFVVVIPGGRLDLRIKEDLIEEIGRFIGYSKVNSRPFSPSNRQTEVPKRTYYAERIREVLKYHGWSEVYTYALRNDGFVALENPLSADRGTLRRDLSGGLQQSLSLNSKYRDLLGIGEIKIFEIGVVFPSRGMEEIHIALGSAAEKGDERIVKDILEKLSRELGGEIILVISDSRVSEFSLEHLVDHLPEPSGWDIPSLSLRGKIFRPYSKYPLVVRDIAVFVPPGTGSKELLDFFKVQAGGLLVNSFLFDVYERDTVDGSKPSFAFRLVFQSADRTLQDAEVNVIMERITRILNGRPGFAVR